MKILNKLVLPLPPSANKYWRNGHNGRVYVSQVAKDYKKEVFYLANIPDDSLFDSKICMAMRFYRKRKIGDGDNFEKILFDALQGVLYRNDRQVVWHSTAVLDDKDNPRVEIRYWGRK